MLKASAISANQLVHFGNGRIKNENVNRLMLEVARCAALSLLFPRFICLIHSHTRQNSLAVCQKISLRMDLHFRSQPFTAAPTTLAHTHTIDCYLVQNSLISILYIHCAKHCFNFGNILIRGFFKRKSFFLPLFYAHLIHNLPPMNEWMYEWNRIDNSVQL